MAASRVFIRRVAPVGAAVALAIAPAAGSPGLGVQTHFEQGWPIAAIAKAHAVGAVAVRDGLAWSAGEPRPGYYDFSSHDDYLKKVCRSGLKVLLVLDPRHPGYDHGKTAFSPEAQAAFGRYVAAVLAAFPHCVDGVEIGNEINAEGGLDYPPGTDAARSYVALLRAVRSAIGTRHPDAALVLGSTNAIATGFLRTLFDAGALDVVDAVAVHPYRAIPENVDVELAHLRQAMGRHARMPIWVTEFGDYFATPEAAPPHLLKMVMLMSAAGIDHFYWYVLLDEAWFANMGLFTGEGALKPAGQAFQQAARALAAGRPQRIDAGDRRTFVFRLASGGYVLWGDPRPLTISGRARAFDARGVARPLPKALSSEPVILSPGARIGLGTSDIIADSLTEFGAASWTYLAQHQGRPPERLLLTDWRWTSRYTLPGLDPLEVNASSLATAGDASRPISPIIRYSSRISRQAYISACFTLSAGDAASLILRVNGAAMPSRPIGKPLRIPSQPVQLRAGEPVDVVISPAGGKIDIVGYRIQLRESPSATAPDCP